LPLLERFEALLAMSDTDSVCVNVIGIWVDERQQSSLRNDDSPPLKVTRHEFKTFVDYVINREMCEVCVDRTNLGTEHPFYDASKKKKLLYFQEEVADGRGAMIREACCVNPKMYYFACDRANDKSRHKGVSKRTEVTMNEYKKRCGTLDDILSYGANTSTDKVTQTTIRTQKGRTALVSSSKTMIGKCNTKRYVFYDQQSH